MQRRELLALGGAVLGTSALGTAQAAPPAPAGRQILAADFGAVGDGKADDTAALQRGLNAAFAEAGGMLVVPPGTYRVTRTLRISPKQNIV
ncbi:glycosyl hydrolase family 28-related protein, partial [Ferrovibrio sp.]|uniref:glycosyl hydrolase family 28-related protein n=1 Tax=Ferrovibrio sp. TaxID=1917215 RepID=UPI000CBB3BD4